MEKEETVIKIRNQGSGGAAEQEYRTRGDEAGGEAT